MAQKVSKGNLFVSGGDSPCIPETNRYKRPLTAPCSFIWNGLDQSG